MDAAVEMTFIDFTQAFNTVSHKFLISAMGEHGIPPKYQRLVQMIYQNATARIKDPNGTQSEPFDFQRGVLQGDILSPILFVLVLNSTWARTNPAVFNGHSGICSDRNLPLELKTRLFTVRVLSTLLYGGESWNITMRILQNLRGFSGKYYIKMANTSFSPNRGVRNNTMGGKLGAAIKAVHVTRMCWMYYRGDSREWVWRDFIGTGGSQKSQKNLLVLTD